MVVHLSQEMFFTAYRRLSNKHMTLTLIHWFSNAVALFFHYMEGLSREMKNWTVVSNYLGSGAENIKPCRSGFWTQGFYTSESVDVKVKFKVLILPWGLTCHPATTFLSKSSGSAAFWRKRNMLGYCGPWWSLPLPFLKSLKYVYLGNWSIGDWGLTW